jgi:hypothetical protein
MQLVSTVTVAAGGAASIEFTSIPQTGTDLLVVLSSRSTAATVYSGEFMRFNSDSGSNYSHRNLWGSGSSATSQSSSTTSFFSQNTMPGASATANTFSNTEFYIPNYTSSVAKSVSINGVGENNATQSAQAITAALWTGTAAITSVTILPSSGNTIAQHTTASLYIITKA